MKFKIKGKRILLLSIATVSIIVIFLGNLIFGALTTRLKQFNKQIKLAEIELIEILQIQKAKDKVAGEYKTYQYFLDIEEWDERKIVEELLKETEHIAKESKVSVVNLSPQPLPETAKECKKYNADLRMDASLDQIFNFLRGIETSKLLIKVDKLTVASKGEDTNILKSEMVIAVAVP